MIENEADDFLPELQDMISGRNFTIALEKYSQWAGKQIRGDVNLLKRIYEGIFDDAKRLIQHKLSHLPHYIDNKNFIRLDLERKVLGRNLEYLESVFSKLDPNKYEWMYLVTKARKFVIRTRLKLKQFGEKYDELIKVEQKRLRNEHERKKKSKQKSSVEKPKIQLLIEPREGDFRNKNMEYLPFLGVTTIRLRVIVNEPVDNLWIKPRFTPDLFSENPEWSYYVCGLNNEHLNFDLRKGFIATYGGGDVSGFKIGTVKKHQEQYVFFALRHHDENLKELIDFSITFNAVEEFGWKEEIISSITIQLRYPEDIRPDQEKELPDFDDPKCPVIARYDYDYDEKAGERYREILFKGNMLASYYPRWIPSRRIEYDPIPDFLRAKMNNLIVRSYPEGDVKIYYKFPDELRLIGHLKGNLSEFVFYDPLKMVTAELFRFYSDDFVALRIWFWWIDMRMNDPDISKITGIKHEMPDFERVDFIINLKDPTKTEAMVEFIATDVHWKEFWCDTKDVKSAIGVKFTNIGVNLINWKQLTAFFSHHVGILYNPLPAILYSIYNSLGDEKAFYCINCGQRTALPRNIKAIREQLSEFDAKDLSEKRYKQKTDQIMADQLTELMCPNCNTMITKDKKLQYIYLFKDFSKLHKHLYQDILKPVLKKKTKKQGAGLALRIQNCHVPTPVDGITSHEWCSSTVTKPLSFEQMQSDQEYEAKIHDHKLEFYDITNLEDLDHRIAAKLYKKGIVKLKDLVNAAASELLTNVDLAGLRQKEIDLYKNNILRWRDMAELYQLQGVRSQYSDLLVEVGLNLKALHDFQGSSKELLWKLEEYNDIHNDVSRLPTLKDIESWLKEAKSIKL